MRPHLLGAEDLGVAIKVLLVVVPAAAAIITALILRVAATAVWPYQCPWACIPFGNLFCRIAVCGDIKAAGGHIART